METNQIGNTDFVVYDTKYGATSNEISEATQEFSALEHVVFAPAAASLGLVDTLLQSTGLTSNDTVADFVKDFGSYGEYYHQYDDNLRLVGDMLGTAAISFGTAGLLRSGGKLYNMAANSGKAAKYLTPMFSSGKTLSEHLSKFRTMANAKAATGFTKNFSRANQPELTKALWSGFRAKAKDTVVETVGTEIALGALMNESELLYPDNMSTAEVIAWNAAIPTLLTGVDAIRTTRAWRQTVASVGEIVESAARGEYAEVAMNVVPTRRSGMVTVDSAVQQSIDELAESATDASAKSDMQAKSLAYKTRVRRQVESMYTDKPFVVNTGIKPTYAQIRSVEQGLADDPSRLLGVTSLEPMPKSQAEVAEKLDNLAKQVVNDRKKLLKLRNSKKAKTNAQAESLNAMDANIRRMEHTEVHAILENGERVMAEHWNPSIYDMDALPKISTLVSDKNNTIRGWQGTIPRGLDGKGGAETLSITNGFNMAFDGANRAKSLTLFKGQNLVERTATFRMFNHALNTEAAPSVVYRINKDASWLEIDGVIERGMRGNTRQGVLAQLNTKLPIGSMDDLIYESMARRYDEYLRLMHKKTVNPNEVSDVTIARMLNLPIPSNGQLHPIQQLFAETMSFPPFAKAGGFREAIKDANTLRTRLTQMAGDTGEELFDLAQTRGKMLNIDDNSRASLAYADPVNANLTASEYAVDVMRMNEHVKQSVLTKNLQSKSPTNIVGAVTRVLRESADTQFIKTEAPNIMHGSTTESIFTSAGFRYRDSPVHMAADRLQSAVSRVTDNTVKKILDTHHEVFQNLRHDVASADIYGIYQQARLHGWDLAPTEELIDEGRQLFGIKLRDTQHNRDLWQQIVAKHKLGDAPMPTYMPNPVNYNTPMALTENALAMANVEKEFGRVIRDNLNVIRKASGQGDLGFKEWYVAPPNLAAKNTAGILAPDGSFLRIEYANTQAELNRKLNASIKSLNDDLAKSGQSGTYTGVSFDQIQADAALNDAYLTDMFDFSDALQQTGKKQTGRLAMTRPEIGYDKIRETVNAYTTQFERVGRRTVALEFESALHSVKLEKQALTTTAEGSIQDTLKARQTSFDLFEQALLGIRNNSESYLPNRINNAAERILDDKLAQLQQIVHSRVTKGTLGTLSPDKAEHRHAIMLDALGRDLTPVSNAIEMAEKLDEFKLPLRSRGLVGQANNLISWVTLRLFDVGVPLQNYLGVPATLPSVIKAAQRQNWESAKEHMGRVGGLVDHFGDGKTVLSPIKIMYQSVHDMFQPEFKKLYKEAADAGYMEQAVAEVIEILNEPTAGWAHKYLFKKNSIPSYIADKSETHSRAMGFIAGLSMAKRLNPKGTKTDWFAAANRIADLTIGDYRPINRPGVFTGVTGMPLGLFMTYIQNYAQRVYRAIEIGDNAALLAQYTAQSSIFGLQTVPGFDIFNNMFSNYDGTTSPEQTLREAYGNDLMDVLMYGTASNLPKLFGQDGVAIYTRGDANIVSTSRVPAILNPMQAPVVQLMKNIRAGVGDLWTGAKNGLMSDELVAQSVGRMLSNRPIRNMLSAYSGAATDATGKVVYDDMLDPFNFAVYLSGLKPMSHSLTQAAMAKQTAMQLSNRARMSSLDRVMRAELIDGSLNDDSISNYVGRAIRFGASPDRLATKLQSLQMDVSQEAWLKRTKSMLNSSNPYEQNQGKILFDQFTDMRQ